MFSGSQKASSFVKHLKKWASFFLKLASFLHTVVNEKASSLWKLARFLVKWSPGFDQVITEYSSFSTRMVNMSSFVCKSFCIRPCAKQLFCVFFCCDNNTLWNTCFLYFLKFAYFYRCLYVYIVQNIMHLTHKNNYTCKTSNRVMEANPLLVNGCSKHCRSPPECQG